MYKRYAKELVEDSLRQGLVTIIYGARQVGKTTLSQEVAKDYKSPLYLNCDDPSVAKKLSDRSMIDLKDIIGSADIVIIDEAQRVENIGITAKLIHDNKLTPNLLLTGSSSLDLANKIKEPLTGRSREIILYPLSIKEVANNIIEADSAMRRALIMGGYPGIWSLSASEAAKRVFEIAHGYLYRDAYAQGTIYDQTVLLELLKLLALQLGNEVSYSELASALEVSKETVMRYVDLLEKAFIVFRHNQFRRNQRVQIGRLRKIYFYDLGMRNALIENLNPLDLRTDVGALWENYIIVERLKLHQQQGVFVSQYYWRNRSKQEIDLVETSSGAVAAIECKWGKKQPKIPSEFSSDYPEASWSVVTPENFWRSFNT